MLQHSNVSRLVGGLSSNEGDCTFVTRPTKNFHSYPNLSWSVESPGYLVFRALLLTSGPSTLSGLVTRLCSALQPLLANKVVHRAVERAPVRSLTRLTLPC